MNKKFTNFPPDRTYSQAYGTHLKNVRDKKKKRCKIVVKLWTW